MQKKVFPFFYSHDDCSELVPSISSELADNRLPIQEGKQTSEESASTSERPRSNKAPVKNFDCHEGPQAQGHRR